MTTELEELADIAAELCDKWTHEEDLYEYTKNRNKKWIGKHISQHAGLLQQLRDLFEPSRSVVGDTGVRVSGGRWEAPLPINLEAMNLSLAIKRRVEVWCEFVGTPRRNSTEEDIKGLVGTAPTMAPDRLVQLLGELRYVRDQAARVTGWTSSRAKDVRAYRSTLDTVTP